MKKILKFLIIVVLIFGFYNFSQASYKTWDFSVDSEYSHQDTNQTIVSGGLGQLKIQLNHKGSITDGGGAAPYLNQAQAIEVVGNYAYITTRTSNALEIVDISNPANPVHVGSIVDGGAVTLRRAQDLVVDGNYAYIAVNRDDAVEIVDISNPANPVHVSSIVRSATIKLNGAIGIDKVGNLLYVASRVDDALEIIDVSNPANPTHVGAITDSTRLNGAEDVKVVGNYAYVTAETNDSFEVIDVSDPANPVFVGQLTNGTNGANLDGASGIAINGNYAYVASSVGDALEIIDITNPTNPIHIGVITNGGTTLLDGAENVIINGNYAFVSSKVSDAIEVIDISNPAEPTHITSIANGGTTLLNGAADLRVVGNYIYAVSDVSNALEIIEISYSSSSPYIIPNEALIYSGSIDKVSDIKGAGNVGTIKYQISKDDGTTWYYLNGTTRLSTNAGATESNSPSEINSEIQTFNGLAGGDGKFKWKAFFSGDGTQKVELDEVKIDYTTAGTNEIIDFETPGGYTVTSGIWTRQTTTFWEGTFAIEADNGGANNSVSCFEVNRDIYADSTISFYRKVDSEASYDFLRFYIDNTKMEEWSGNVAWGSGSYSIGNGNHTFKWCYEKDGSVSNGADTAWVDYIEIKELPAPPVEVVVLDFEVAGGYTVTTNLTAEDWFRQQNTVYEGQYALQSANITDNQTVCFERVQTVSSIDTGISFYRKVDSESGWDFLRFYIDGTLKDEWSGNIDWTKQVYTLSPATYTLRWCYEKDGSVSNGADTAWIDLVSVTQDPPIITEVTPVPTPTNDNTPDYTFYSPISGTISYSGSCFSSTNTGAVVGNNTITFDTLADGIYTDCTIQVLASPQNSTILPVSNFTIDTTKINIVFNNPVDGGTIASAPFNIDISYSDDNGVNTGSIVLQLFEWDGSSYGPDIASSFVDFSQATIIQTGAIYPTSALTGSTQYKIEFSIDDNVGNNSVGVSVFDIASGDVVPPNISSINFSSGTLLPGGNHNIIINYSDADSGIDTSSDTISLNKWDGSSWGADISATGLDLGLKTITSTGATYSTNNLNFGKYRYNFSISDNIGNDSSTGAVFYIDEPELIVSTGSANIGTIKTGSGYFSNELTITIKTVGAGFDLILNKIGPVVYDIYEIVDYNGVNGVGYDKEPYTSTIYKINTNEIIASQSGSINTDGNKNNYIYKMRMGASVGEEQTAGNYSGSLRFTIDLNY